MSDFDLPIDWKPEPNEYDEPTPLPFFEGIITTRWDFEDGSYLTLEQSEDGYLFGGKINGQDIHGEDWEDLYFPDTDSLLDFLEDQGLLKFLSKKPTT